MGKNKRGKQLLERTEEGIYQRFLFIAIVVLTVGALFYPPLFRGLYFEDEQFPFEALVFFIMALVCLYKFINRGRLFISTPAEYFLLGLTLFYGLSIFWAVNPRMALSEFLKYAMYFATFYIISEISSKKSYKMALLWSSISSIFAVCILSIDAAVGAGLYPRPENTYGPISKVLNGILSKLGFKESFFDIFIDGKIYSTLQYSNAFALVVLTAFIIVMGMMLLNKNKRNIWIYAGCAFVFLNTSIYSFSRGVFLLFPIVLILFFVLLPGRHRIKALFNFLAVVLAVLLVSVLGYMKWFVNSAGYGLHIWILTLIGMGLTIGLVYVSEYGIRYAEYFKFRYFKTIITVLSLCSLTYIIIAFNYGGSITLAHTKSMPHSIISKEKVISLEANKTYILKYKVSANMVGEKAFAYYVSVYSKNFADIVGGAAGQKIGYTEGKSSKGFTNKELEFKVPPDSKTSNIYFGNYFNDTSVTFLDAEIWNKDSGKKVTNLVLKYILLPQKLAERFESITLSRSFLERKVFVGDAIKIVKDYPVFGGGGSTWQTLYSKYQSYAYKSTQTHSYPLQVILEVGLFGFVLWVGLVISIICMFIIKFKEINLDDNNRVFLTSIFTALIFMLLHSSVDFDFSLSAVFLIFWLLVGLLNNLYRDGTDVVNNCEKEIHQIKGFAKIRKYLTCFPEFRVNPIVILILLVVIAIIPVRLYNATVNFEKAKIIEKKDIRTAMNHAKKAVDLDGGNLLYKLNYINMVLKSSNRSKDEVETTRRYLKELETQSEYSYDISQELGKVNFMIGEIDGGLKDFERATMQKPRHQNSWYQYFNACLSSIINLDKVYINEDEKVLNKKRIEIAKKSIEMVEKMNKINKQSLVPFELDSKILNLLQKIKYVYDNGGSIRQLNNQEGNNAN